MSNRSSPVQGGDLPMFNLPPSSANYESLPGGSVDAHDVEVEPDVEQDRDLLRSSQANVGRHWHNFFSLQRGNDFEAARVNHIFNSEERRKLAAFESIDYFPANSKSYRMWLKDQVYRRQWDKWVLMFFVGISVAVIGYLMYTMIELLSHFKYGVARWVLTHYNIFLSWLFTVSVSLLLVFFASALVVYVAPAAGGSGVPECMAFLNGVHIDKIFNLNTLIVKFLSCAAAVGAGMPIGPEGPMLHMGAIVGAGLSQGESTTLGFRTNFFRRFRNSRDKRDFVTAGVAVGVAVAFNAPVGGLLFAFEEVASYWSVTLSWQIFFCCMAGFLGIGFLRSIETAVLEGEGLGVLDSISFEVQSQITSHAISLLPAAVVGLVTGGLAILFTIFNVKVARLRQALAPPDKPVARIMEPLIIMFIYATLSTFLPLAFDCIPTGCFVDEHTEVITCPPETTPNMLRIVEKSVTLYTCKQNVTWPDFSPGGDNSTGPTSYNELATLMSVTGEDAIKHLFTRRTHLEFGWASVMTMLVVYFTLAAVAAGSALSAGLFVPMLVIGACAGRLVGLAATHGMMSYGLKPPSSMEDFTPDSPWMWIDPGAFAFVGAGAFMGGVTRLTVSLSVIMMEISNDIRLLPPILLAILIAKTMADLCTHPLYHALLELKCVPFLPGDPNSSTSPDLLPVTTVMQSPVITIKETDRVAYIKQVLRETTHGVFPIVRSTANGQVFVGSITRAHLKVLLRRLATLPAGVALDVSYEELQARVVSKLEREVLADQEMALLHDIPRSDAPAFTVNGEADSGSPDSGVRQRSSANGHGGFASGSIGRVGDAGSIDLRPYMNTSAPAVLDTFSVERAYIMFRTLGLRHLIVVDAVNHVVGIIARQDLVGYRLDDAVAKAQRRGDL